MATEQEVAAQRAKTDAVREAVRQARAAQSTTAREGEADVKLASLSNEEAMLQQELNRLTAGDAAAAPAPAPAPAPKPASGKGADTDQEG